MPAENPEPRPRKSPDDFRLEIHPRPTSRREASAVLWVALHSANDIIRAVGAQVNAQGELNMALDTANFLLEDAITLLDEWFAPDAVEPIDGGSRGPDGGCSHEP